MTRPTANYWRYFATYSGIKLPLKLMNELQGIETDNRNTFFRTGYDAQGKLAPRQKLVYGKVEMEHRYSYYDRGTLEKAEITMAGETRQILFADTGASVE